MLRRLAHAALALLLLPAPALAADGVDGWAEVTLRAVESNRAVVEGDDIDSSGIGIAVDTGFEWKGGRTAVQFDLGAEAFDYSDNTRETRQSATGGVTLSHELGDNLTLAVTASHGEDIVTQESRETDQDAVRGEVTWQKGDDRVRLRAQYRWREYLSDAADRAEGLRVDAQYQRRFGNYHWLRLDAAREDLDAVNPLRGFERTTLRASYSRPVAKYLRLRPTIEYRDWTYDARRVGGDPDAPLRRDRYVAPEIGLSYGHVDRGPQARLRAAWQLRSSNDPAYREDAPYFEAAIGWRF